MGYFDDMGPDKLREDEFLQDDTYDIYDGPDMSDDPMVLGEPERLGRRERRRREQEAIRERELEKQRMQLKAEILAEIKAERDARAKGEVEDRAEAERVSADDWQGSEASACEAGADSVVRESVEPRRRSKFSEYFMSVISGNILSRAEVRRVYPYLLFLAFLAFLYIGNVFRMQQLYRKHENLTKQVKELRAKSMTIASQKMNATRQSVILQEIEKRGLPLHESLTPNKVIPK